MAFTKDKFIAEMEARLTAYTSSPMAFYQGKARAMQFIKSWLFGHPDGSSTEFVSAARERLKTIKATELELFKLAPSTEARIEIARLAGEGNELSHWCSGWNTMDPGTR